MAGAQVLAEGLANPAALLELAILKRLEQLLLTLEREAGELPAQREALEQELDSALPAILEALAAGLASRSPSLLSVPALSWSRRVRTLPCGSR